MKYDIENILTMYEDDYNPRSMVPGPRNMKLAQVPRSEMDNFNTPDLEQSPDSFLRPGETLEDFDVEFRRPNAEGGQLVAPSVDGSRPGYSGYDKDKRVLDAETIKKIKEKIKLKPGQKWNFYDPNPNSKTYRPKGHTYGIEKAKYPKLWDVARNIGKPGRAEKKLKQATEKYKKIKANPKLLEQKKAYDRELYMGKREKVLEDLQFKYATNKDFREGKLEWAKQDRIKNPEKYKKKMSDYYAKKGQFPTGNNYKENVWRDMFRSSQKSGQERFLLVDEKGNLLTEDKFPKVDGKVRWDVGGAYKKVKFYDTLTEQFVKFDNTIKGKGIGFEKYLDQKEVGGKGAFKNAIYGYKIKDDYKNLTFKDSKGKTIRLGTFIQNQLIDGSDFIKSGINVQHSDLNNAFWKNEVSLASSNQELKNLESTVERELRAANKIDDVKLKNIAKNKAIKTFKTKIEKLPGGITKVIEGTTYGIKPTERGLIRAAGKEFGATRYKDFENLLKKLCPKGQASGGRIGFKNGTPTVGCGAKALDDGLATGKWESPEKANIAKEVLKKAGKSGIGARLLSELFGPVAIATLPIFEAGIAGYDTITSGTPFNEAINKTLLSPLLGDKLKADPEKLKRADILKMADGPQKEMLIKYYGDVENLNRVMNNYKQKAGLEQDKELYEAVGIGGYGDDGSAAAQAQKQIEAINKKISQDRAQEKDYMTLSRAVDDPYAKGLAESLEGELLAKRDANSLSSRMFGTENPYYTSPTSSYTGEVLPERIEAMKAKGPTYDQLNKWSPGASQDKGLYSRDQIIEFLGSVPDIEITDENVDFLQTKLNADYFKNVLKQPGMLGTQYSEGGIASLNVNKK